MHFFKFSKVLSIFILTLFISVCSNIGQADASRGYYNGDPNCPKVGMYHNRDIYIYKSSVHVDEYNPPIYQITGTVFFIDQSTGECTNTHEETFRYNYKKGTMYVKNSNNWEQISSGSYNATAMLNLGTGLEFFRTAYNMDFPLR